MRWRGLRDLGELSQGECARINSHSLEERVNGCVPPPFFRYLRDVAPTLCLRTPPYKYTVSQSYRKAATGATCQGYCTGTGSRKSWYTQRYTNSPLSIPSPFPILAMIYACLLFPLIRPLTFKRVLQISNWLRENNYITHCACFTRILSDFH